MHLEALLCDHFQLRSKCSKWEEEGACCRSTLLQHTPGAKLPPLHQRFLAKKYVAQQNFCSRVLLPHIKLVWFEGASFRGKLVARVCFRSKLPRVYWDLLAVTWRDSSWPVKLAYFLVPMLQTGCFIIQLPRRVLRVYWSGYLPGSVFLERVSGANSPVCTSPKTPVHG